MKNWLTLVRQKKTSFPNERNLSKTERFFKIVSAAIEFPSKKIIGGHESVPQNVSTKLTFRVLFSWPEAYSRCHSRKIRILPKVLCGSVSYAALQRPSWSSWATVIWSHQNKQLSPLSHLCLGLIWAALSRTVAYLMPCIKESPKTVRGINSLLNRARQ